MVCGHRAAAQAGRRQLHGGLLERWRDAGPDVARDRHALLLAGPPGAGKSTAQKNLADTLGVALERWRVVNSDDFKDLLRAALGDGSIKQLTPSELRELEGQGERFWAPELAAIVHDEAGQLVGRATSETIASGENVIIDGTLSDPERALSSPTAYTRRPATRWGSPASTAPRRSSISASATAGAPATWRPRQAPPRRARG